MKTYEMYHHHALSYIEDLYQTIRSRDPEQTEYHQAIAPFFKSILPALAQNPVYMEKRILEQMTEPDRTIIFRVPWMRDDGNVEINRGYRVQFNNALGPYKGGIRFHPSVSLSVIKFLAFNQVIKNALTNLPLGGAKGGSDFNPKGKSDAEIMRFCQSFMNELQKYIGPDMDIPAGDIGVGEQEIGYMFGQYKRIHSTYHGGILTGKGTDAGGSAARVEATGYGAIYFAEEMLRRNAMEMNGQTLVISGSGNVSIHAMEKASVLGARIIACSDSDGYIKDEEGIDPETVKKLKNANGRICDYVDYHPGASYFPDCTDIWSVPCDVALPCATENELDREDAENLIANGVKAVAEGANMPSTKAAVDLFKDHNILFGPAKAVNAGGVAVSALEMTQNTMGQSWSFAEVDRKLQEIMKGIFTDCMEAAATYGQEGDLDAGSNIVGFERIAKAMIAHGIA